jgi:tetratricopeptide (TPR) repeat protein
VTVVASADKSRQIDDFLSRLQQSRDEKSDVYDFHWRELIRAGTHLLDSGHAEVAIAILKANAESYPEEATPILTLGDAYRKSGNKTEAAKAYAEALRLQPDEPGLPGADHNRPAAPVGRKPCPRAAAAIGVRHNARAVPIVAGCLERADAYGI